MTPPDRPRLADERARFDAKVAFFNAIVETPAHREMVDALESALGDLPPGPALELGCGGGALLSRWARRGRRVLGGDLSLAMCGHARGTLGCDVVATDATRLPFRDGAFAAVAGTLYLQVVPDPEAALLEALRVLRPGGRHGVVVQSPAFDGRDDGRRLARAREVSPLEAEWFEGCAHRSPHSARFSAPELAARFTDAGFADVRSGRCLGDALAWAVGRRRS